MVKVYWIFVQDRAKIRIRGIGIWLRLGLGVSFCTGIVVGAI